jgi:antitoxin (DNA-binding transcriptional repressor) of toxin-antitoxin stability system
MRSITFTEFRKNASSLISEVEKGEIIQLIRHGKPVAEICPFKPKEKTLPSWKKPGLRLTVKGGSLSEAILQERRNSE